MLWIIVDRVVNLTFLLLAAIIITILLQTRNKDSSDNNLYTSISVAENKLSKAISKNTEYFDTRVNNLARTQDEYQSSTHGKLSVLERRIENIEKNRANNKNSVVVNNTNNVSPFVSPKQE